MIMRKRKKNELGSMTLGAMIIMLLVAAVGISIINRTTSGIKIASDMKRGYGAYQGSDAAAERLMNQLRLLDSDVTSGKIPENTCAWSSVYCDSADAQCKLDGDFESSGSCNGSNINKSDSVASVVGVRKKVTENGMTRFLEAPTQERIESGLQGFDGDGLKAEKCGQTLLLPSNPCSGSSNNRCDLLLTLKPASSTEYTDKISSYEVRRSISQFLGTQDPYGWQYVYSFGNPTGTQKYILKNGGDSSLLGYSLGETSGGQYNKKYYFTAKAKNKNPFYLDSLYLSESLDAGKAPVDIHLENNADCRNRFDDGHADTQLHNLGCIIAGTNPVGTSTSAYSYNCCNGTECYEPDPHWKKNPGEDCALQECGYNEKGYSSNRTPSPLPSVDDSVLAYPSGDGQTGNGVTTGTGWCKPGAVEGCVAGNSCTHPYRVVGYCSACPDSSAKEGGVYSSSWSKQNIMDVDMNPVSGGGESFSPNNQQEARCCRHDCPTQVGGTIVQTPLTYCGALPYRGTFWTASSTTCSQTNTCGEYALTKKCALNCSNANYGFYPANPSPEYPSGTCCKGNCPTEQYYNTSCGTTSNGSYSNVSTCTSRCATSETDTGYTVTKICNLACNSGYSRDTSTATTEYPLGKACVLTNVKKDCSGTLPANTVWNGSTQFTQTWDGNSYEPSETSVHYDTTYGDCHYKCATNYVRSGSSCVAATRTYTCSDKPATGTSWNTVSSYTQTWSGGSWTPADDSVTEHNDTASSTSCRYTCSSGYAWDGDSCELEVASYCTVEFTNVITFWGNRYCGSTVISNVASGGYVCVKIDGNTSLYVYDPNTATYNYIANGKTGPYQMWSSYTLNLYDSDHNWLCSGTINVP